MTTKITIRALETAFGLSNYAARKVRTALLGTQVPAPCGPRSERLARACYPLAARDYEMRLAVAADLIDGSEVEAIFEYDVCEDWDDTLLASYINTGDLYSATISYDHASREYRLTTYADERERLEFDVKITRRALSLAC